MDKESQKKLITVMTGVYCRKKHKTKDGLCPECTTLAEYSEERLTHCPFGGDKPFCSHCKVHCFKPDMRQKIKEVMRYSGPRMFFKHPLTVIRHGALIFKQKLKNKNKDKDKTKN